MFSYILIKIEGNLISTIKWFMFLKKIFTVLASNGYYYSILKNDTCNLFKKKLTIIWGPKFYLYFFLKLDYFPFFQCHSFYKELSFTFSLFFFSRFLSSLFSVCLSVSLALFFTSLSVCLFLSLTHL